MEKQFIKIISAIALVALLSIQGIWLSNTYTLLHEKLITDLEEGFARAIETEVYQRLDDNKEEIQRGEIIGGVRPDHDFYINVLAFHEFLLSWDLPLSMAMLDSIWSKKLADDIGTVKYLLLKTDSARIPTEQINRGVSGNSPYTLTIERPVRIDNSEYLQVVIESPYKIILGRMFVLLVTSFLIALILGYCIYLQISLILRQGRIAEIRQDFTQAMVHDMKNPITNIYASANMLKSGALDSKPHLKNQYFDIQLKEINRLMAFSNKILTIAKFEEKTVQLEKSDLDVNQLFNSLVEEYLLSPSKEIRFTTDCEDGCMIYADSEYMADVFRNLIDNAIKYSKNSVSIHLKAIKEKKETIVQIMDNGIGISSKDQKRLFKKFERVPTREKERKSGFGLGLYYVYQIVTAHGGTVKVESVPDQYSEFTLIIPNK